MIVRVHLFRGRGLAPIRSCGSGFRLNIHYQNPSLQSTIQSAKRAIKTAEIKIQVVPPISLYVWPTNSSRCENLSPGDLRELSLSESKNNESVAG